MELLNIKCAEVKTGNHRASSSTRSASIWLGQQDQDESCKQRSRVGQASSDLLRHGFELIVQAQYLRCGGSATITATQAVKEGQANAFIEADPGQMGIIPTCPGCPPHDLVITALGS